MKKALINYIKHPRYDEFYTPPEAIHPLLRFLPKDKIYWECTNVWFNTSWFCWKLLPKD